MNFEAAKQYIINRLIHELSSKLYYHGLHHTFDVYDAVKQLAVTEQISGEELVLLKTAALYHDAGFIEQYAHNEPIAVKIAQQALPKFGYSTEQIAIIATIIMTTNMQHPPQTHLEKIMCDADLDYLGRTDFSVLSGLLRKEWEYYGKTYSDKEWDELQVMFLEKHKYYTDSAINKNAAAKQLRIEEVKRKLQSKL
jgi:predicted metal-dependent HD superfamily phosphohydrolase